VDTFNIILLQRNIFTQPVSQPSAQHQAMGEGTNIPKNRVPTISVHPIPTPPLGMVPGNLSDQFPSPSLPNMLQKPQERVLQNDEILLPNARELVWVKVKFTFGVIAPI